MVGREREKNLVHQQNVLKVVDHTLPVQKVHGGCEEIPVQRFGESEILLLTRDVGNGDDLLEGHNLNRGDQANDIDVSREERDEEACDHDKGPYRARNEGLLLLFIVGLRRFLKNA